MASFHANKGSKRAREALADRALSSSGDRDDLLSAVEARAPVLLRRFPDWFAGACVRRDRDHLIVVNAAQGHPRQRFTLAHELGHICCGHDTETIVDTIEMVSGADTSSVEVQANAFAAEFLAPRAALQGQQSEPDLEAIVRLANAFGVSAIMMTYRFNTLGLISEKRMNRLKAEIAEDDHIALSQHLRLQPMEDRITLIADSELPYLSPSLAGSALGAALAGSTSIESAARVAGTSASRLATAIGP